MITKLIGAATLFAAGSLMGGGSTVVAATPIGAIGTEATLTQAGDRGAEEPKEEAKAKDGSCGKDKKEASCGADKK
jgi:hypothetical protein